ncbi:MAG: hypothetical protein WBG20_08310 [Candidatus Deferrimicrobiaceae bacterium]
MKNRSRNWKSWEKAVFAASLLVIFGTVVFSVPAGRLAWQGPLVMGTLAMPTPSVGTFVRTELQSNSDSLFSFMGFLSVAGILVLTGRSLIAKPFPGKGTEKEVLPLVFP